LKAKKRARKEEKRNAGIDARNERDMEQRLKDRQTADKVRRKLEAKSRLYEAVHNGEELDDYLRENCLVDFDGKEIDRSRERRGDPRYRPRETKGTALQSAKRDDVSNIRFDRAY